MAKGELQKIVESRGQKTLKQKCQTAHTSPHVVQEGFKKSKPCARIERSVLRLQPYDFHVVHIHTNKTQQTRFTSTWGFLFSTAEKQLICFTKRRNNNKVNIKLYGQEQEQVQVMRFLGMWMDDKLIFSIHIQQLIDNFIHTSLITHKDRNRAIFTQR